MIQGFSRLSKEQKQEIVLEHINDSASGNVFDDFNLSDSATQELIESFSENVTGVFPFPYGIVPNVLINGKEYFVPFVTEESSVVAAAAKAAKFWYDRGGFHSEIIGTTKHGHIHLTSNAGFDKLFTLVEEHKDELLASVSTIDDKMKSRGGGIQTLKLLDKTENLKEYFQIEVGFNTCNAMGANYMNSCLEGIAGALQDLVFANFESVNFEIIMSILSNYSPDNAVKVWVEAPVDALDDGKLGMSSETFAHKFVKAVQIAEADTSRAVTHNKGFYNGLDSVVLATGNDWRAIEANGHAYASSNGMYKSLSHAEINKELLRFEASIPLQVGTVGGVTKLHPLSKLSLGILGNPSAKELMAVMAVAGLASNFSAVKALVTTGIQKGHMKMHLSNILSSFNATPEEKERAKVYFSDKTVSNSAVELFLNKIRS